MKSLPPNPNLEHLRKQAKDAQRPGQKLSQAQHDLAREYGFRSWADLRTYVETVQEQKAFAELFRHWLVLVYGEGVRGPRPYVAERMLQENPRFGELAPYAIGDLEGIRKNPQATAGMPPLVALTHSSFCRLRPNAFEACVRSLIADGADVNATRIDPGFPNSPLSVLYGAAGRFHLPALTKILLDAGANPNDGESVYHAVEDRSLTCLRLLLAAGATVKGTNAINHSLDYNDLQCTKLLLDAGGDPNEGVPALFWAIRRRRSVAHFDALLVAGADARAMVHGHSIYHAALFVGLRAVAAKIREHLGIDADEISGVAKFISLCTAADREAATAMLQERNWISEIPPELLRLLPDQIEAGNFEAVRLMVELGWPIAAVGGDWKATALNLAVFRGAPEWTAFLLQHGASWEERHGFQDDVRGTLSFASMEEPMPGGDWLECAKALVAAGMPKPDPKYTYSDEITAYFESLDS